ncbi:MAG: glycosyltransferase [Actinomycetes bacterium]
MPHKAAGRQPHLLYVAWGFPPCRGGGVYRALATANTFAEAGWEVTVLTAPRETFLNYTGADIALEAQIDPRIKIERVPFSWPSLETDIRKYSWLRVHFPRVWRRLRKQADVLRFPEPAYGPWRPTLAAAARRIHQQRPIDLVVATANPAVAFVPAAVLHGVGVPYVLDYRDAWSLDVFSGDRVHAPNSRVGRWESRLIKDAREIWFVNEPIRAWHQQAYSGAANRMFVVSNGWDTAPEFGFRAASPEPVFGYLGTVSPKVPLAELVEGWRLARKGNPAISNAKLDIRGYLGFYGTPRPELQAIVDGALDDGLKFGGSVPKTEVGNLYATWDVLLLVLGSGRYVTSGKVFEYLATGLPIVSVHDPGNAATDVLRGYPSWFPAASLAPADIAAALSAAMQAAQAHDEARFAAGRQFAEQYRRDRQLLPRIAELRAGIAT